jgi:hypothetical protein
MGKIVSMKPVNTFQNLLAKKDELQQETEVTSLDSQFTGAGSETQSEAGLDNPVVEGGKKKWIYFTEMIAGECFGETSLFED